MKSRSYTAPRAVIFISYPCYFLCLLRDPLHVVFFFHISRLNAVGIDQILKYSIKFPSLLTTNKYLKKALL
jgi:hypothetical protein